jgi:hypothetical protein
MNVRFNTKNLEYYDVKKINEQIFVELKYTNIKEKIQKKLELDDIRFITHWKLTQIGNLGWITFFYLNEVFDICDSEKKYFKEKFAKEKK